MTNQIHAAAEEAAGKSTRLPIGERRDTLTLQVALEEFQYMKDTFDHFTVNL